MLSFYAFQNLPMFQVINLKVYIPDCIYQKTDLRRNRKRGSEEVSSFA
jgi:hypothetical protein